jgi:pheromone shutdown protein TraB
MRIGVQRPLSLRAALLRRYHTDTMMVLRSATKEVFLIGTYHGSGESANQVRECIQTCRPDSVVLELCLSRAVALKTDNQPVQGARSVASRPPF